LPQKGSAWGKVLGGSKVSHVPISSNFLAAMLMIERLLSSDKQKAEAIRRRQSAQQSQSWLTASSVLRTARRSWSRRSKTVRLLVIRLRTDVRSMDVEEQGHRPASGFWWWRSRCGSRARWCRVSSTGFQPTVWLLGHALDWLLPVRRRKRHGGSDCRLRHLVRLRGQGASI
jgi:hypothetical protein